LRRLLQRALPGVLLAAAVLGPGFALAQSTSATLIGKVITEQGTAVPGAVVQARSEGSGAVRTSITGDNGEYRIESLSTGLWTVVARVNGGSASESRVIRLRLQQVVRVDFTVGTGLTEHVTVTADAPLIDAKETAGVMRINEEQMEALPLSGRVFTDLALLDSSVQKAAPGVFFGERGTVFTVNGQSGRSNSFLVDGLDNNDQTSGTTLNAFYSQQVIDEFVLLTHQYRPEFGNASGGVLNIVTKRGSNQFGWSAFAQGSSAQWNNSGEFVDSLPERDESEDSINRYWAGFTFSGPIKKDKAFYFVAYEHMDFDDLIPYTGYVREDIDDPEATGGGRFVAPSFDDNFFLRTDFNLGENNTLMLRLGYDDRETQGINVGGIMTPESGFRIEERDVTLAGTLTTVVSPKLINEVRVLAADSAFEQYANSDRPGVTRPSGIFGGNILNLQDRSEQRIQLVDNITLRSGEHTLKFGLDVTHSSTRIQTAFNPNGNFLYNYDFPYEVGECGGIFRRHSDNADDPTAVDNTDCSLDNNLIDDDSDGIVDEKANILSYPLIYQFVFGQPEATLDDTRLGIFAQDSWQISKKFLLDYGFRYDVNSYVLPDEFTVDSSVPNGGAQRDTDNIAPRVGFTYTPSKDGKLLMRGGAGIFYDKLVLGFPAVSAITSGTEIGLFFPQGMAWERDESYIEENGIDAVMPELLDLKEVLSSLIMRFSTGTELETPYSVQFNIGMDKAIGERSAFSANLTRSQGYNQPMMIDLNPVDGLVYPGLDCTEANLDPDIEPYEGLPCHLNDTTTGSIAALVTEGQSWYTGLELNYRWRRMTSWFSASYTLSKAENTGFDPLKGGISLPPDSENLEGERGRADGDRRHRMVITGDTGLPWLGLRLSGSWQLSSGLAFNVTTGIDDNVDGILTDRPEGVRRNSGADTPLAPINALRMEHNQNLPEDQQLEPVTSLSEPHFSQIDLRLYRPFPFADGRGVGNFYFQVFNVLDRENAGLIEGRVISKNFGRPITLAGPPRTIELGLKLAY
jgi:hypothetical protein